MCPYVSPVLIYQDFTRILTTKQSGFFNAVQSTADPLTTSFSFMWSYPNMIPLPPVKIHGIWTALKPFEFEETYGGFPGQNVKRKGLKKGVLQSMKVFLKVGGHEEAGGVFGEEC